jgi:hypothetical protein
MIELLEHFKQENRKWKDQMGKPDGNIKVDVKRVGLTV